MAISLSETTQKLIEDYMKETGISTPDELVQMALQALDQTEHEGDYDDLDAETQAAIERGIAQMERSEWRPWEEVREELRTRFIDKGG